MEPVVPSPRKHATLAELMPRLTDNLFLKYESNPKKFELLANCMICCSKYSSPPMQYDCGHRVCESCHVKLTTKADTAVVSPTLKNVAVSPISKKMGNTFCSPQIACPSCRSSVASMMKDLAYYRERVMPLQLKCPNSVTGCEWSGCLSDVGEHLSVPFNCAEELIDCSACHVPIKGKNMKHHQSECRKRPVLCQYCKRGMAFDTLEYHYIQSCMEYPVPCQNECGLSLPRSSLLHHVQNICENAVVLCPYRCVNCFHTVLRKNLNQHLTEFIQQHLDMTRLFAHSAATEMASMKREFDEFKAHLKHEKESASTAVESQLQTSLEKGSNQTEDAINSDANDAFAPQPPRRNFVVKPLYARRTKKLVDGTLKYWKAEILPEFLKYPWVSSALLLKNFNVATLMSLRDSTVMRNEEFFGCSMKELIGKQACTSFVVSTDAWPFVVGFKSQTMSWTLSSSRKMEIRRLTPSCGLVYDHVATELGDFPFYPMQENTVSVRIVEGRESTRRIQFICNGRMIKIDQKFVLYDEIVFPYVCISQIGDSVAMLDYSNYSARKPVNNTKNETGVEVKHERCKQFVPSGFKKTMCAYCYQAREEHHGAGGVSEKK